MLICVSALRLMSFPFIISTDGEAHASRVALNVRNSLEFADIAQLLTAWSMSRSCVLLTHCIFCLISSTGGSKFSSGIGFALSAMLRYAPVPSSLIYLAFVTRDRENVLVSSRRGCTIIRGVSCW